MKWKDLFLFLLKKLENIFNFHLQELRYFQWKNKKISLISIFKSYFQWKKKKEISLISIFKNYFQSENKKISLTSILKSYF